MQYDRIIIGAGAAGLACAGFSKGKNVLVLEKNEKPARKLAITGKGRCNVTNFCEPDDFIKFVKTNGKFLYSSINALTPRDTMQLFEDLGVSLKVERGNRVYPASDNAFDIVDALIKFAKRNSVQIKNAVCGQINVHDGCVTGVTDKSGNVYKAKEVVIATGGKSYPGTGSTGDGYTMAQELGHAIITPKASLVPIVIKEDWCKELMGLSLKNVILKMSDKKVVFSQMGEMLFTHFGISGPLVLSVSAHIKKNINEYSFSLDLKPALSNEQLDARILRDFAECTNKDFINALGGLLPRKLIPVFVKLTGIDEETKINQITKEQRIQIVETMKNIKMTPKSLRPIEEAVITSGGVSTKEIDPKTMQSKLVKGLYFAGEVIDVDAYTGGYNLQIAFSTAYNAGVN